MRYKVKLVWTTYVTAEENDVSIGSFSTPDKVWEGIKEHANTTMDDFPSCAIYQIYRMNESGSFEHVDSINYRSPSLWE